ncbi:MAG TPA: hypothetical protein VI795_02325 [Patescibacteria group bacterium]|nr:hypothetical protein [Patescibacteria group bacterium]
MEKELTPQQEEHLWQVINFHPQTREQANNENYIFLKSAYFDLIKYFYIRLDLKNAELLEKAWEEKEKQYLK